MNAVCSLQTATEGYRVNRTTGLQDYNILQRLTSSSSRSKMAARAALLLCAAFHLLTWSDAVNIQAKEKEILDKILKDYDSRIRPNYFNNSGSDADGPTVVRVNMFIRSISDVDDNKMETTLQVTLRQSWTDTRLRYDDLAGRIKYLTLTNPGTIWTPDLFFSNEKQAYFHNVVTPNVYLRIFPSGFVLYSTRISLVLSCPMNLKLYPFDRQICSVRMASYGFTTNDLVFLWKDEDPVQVVKNLRIPHFSLEKFISDYCNSKTNTGEYSCIKVDLLFERQASYYVRNVFLPTSMLVILSWVAFWLDQSAVTSRVFIGVTTLLAMAMHTIYLSRTVGPTSYTTQLDYWTGSCLLFLFLSIQESATVNFFYRHGGFKEGMKKHGGVEGGEGAQMTLLDREQESPDAPTAASGRPRKLSVKERTCRYLRWITEIPTHPQRLDWIARLVFPLGFALFVMIYWRSNVFDERD